MYILASFQYSLHLELAITDLIERGITREHLFAVPLEVRGETREIFDTIHHADGVSMFDGAAILGAALMTLGVIYGFVHEWGPVIWGLAGLVGGFGLGFVIDYLNGIKRHSKKNRRREQLSEVIIMVKCNASQVDLVKQVFWGHQALGLGVLPGKKPA
ncbi:MAG: hypothetical protein PHF87_10665 [Desulfotomaculaceae bacterium]|nr:hypothetical protein [Desulfotomaculaceae bacterium]